MLMLREGELGVGTMAAPDSDGEQSQPTRIQRIVGHFQGKTVSGLLELLPILVPIVVIVYVVNLVDTAVVPILDAALRALTGDTRHFPDVWGIGLVLTIGVFYLVGLLTTTRLGKGTIGLLKDVMGSIPVVRGLLAVTRQATTMVTSEYSFSRAVFLEWPREGMVALGFVTARVAKAGSTESLALVYIPTVPNPTSGNMALVSEDDLFETDLTVENAMRLVFSGGIVPPDAITLARTPIEYRVDSRFTGRFETDR